MAVALFLFAFLPSPSSAQDESLDEERAGSSRGGSYAWGESTDSGSGPSGPATHRYGRVFVSVGAGLTVRVLQYEALRQQRLAPPYLQLRGGFFFEGDGDFQHGVGLGISTNINGEGAADRCFTDTSGATQCDILGVDPFGAWTLTPQYLARIWFDDWIQLVGRVGVSVTAAAAPNWGFEIGFGPLVKFLSGFGAYAELSFSSFFAAEFHPLFSGEVGLVIDYELLP